MDIINSSSNSSNNNLYKVNNEQFTINKIYCLPKKNLNNYKHIKVISLIKKLHQIEYKKGNYENLRNIKVEDYFINEQKTFNYRKFTINKNKNKNSIRNIDIKLDNNFNSDNIKNNENKIKELNYKLKDSKNEQLILDKINCLIKLKLIILIKILEDSNSFYKIEDKKEKNNKIEVNANNFGDKINYKEYKTNKNGNIIKTNLLCYFLEKEIDKLSYKNKCLTSIEDNKKLNVSFIGRKRFKSLEI